MTPRFQYGMRVRLLPVADEGEEFGTVVEAPTDAYLEEGGSENYTVLLDGEFWREPDEDGFEDDGLRDVPGDQMEAA